MLGAVRNGGVGRAIGRFPFAAAAIALVTAAAVLLTAAVGSGTRALADSPRSSNAVRGHGVRSDPMVRLGHGLMGGRGRLSESSWIRATMAHMTLPEEVGQVFEVNGYGTSVRDTDPAMVALNQKYYGVDNIAQLIDKYHPGGIIYFNWSNTLTDPSQIVNLSNGIQQVALSHHTPVPMVISADQEGGEVVRIGSPATVFPGNMPLGATRNLALAYNTTPDGFPGRSFVCSGLTLTMRRSST